MEKVRALAGLELSAQGRCSSASVRSEFGLGKQRRPCAPLRAGRARFRVDRDRGRSTSARCPDQGLRRRDGLPVLRVYSHLTPSTGISPNCLWKSRSRNLKTTSACSQIVEMLRLEHRLGRKPYAFRRRTTACRARPRADPPAEHPSPDQLFTNPGTLKLCDEKREAGTEASAPAVRHDHRLTRRPTNWEALSWLYTAAIRHGWRRPAWNAGRSL